MPDSLFSHRPWPRPSGPHVGHMTWRELLFAHWRVDPGEIRPWLPEGLELDLYDGEAWIGIVPFVMAGTRPRGLPAVSRVSDFPELNVRTYVRRTGGGTIETAKPGVFFFSLDAASRLAVRVARKVFALPYFDARMRVETDGEAVAYDSARTHRDAPPAVFRARYEPTGPVYLAEPGTLEHWLTERYCLYAAKPFAWQRPDLRPKAIEPPRIYRSEIHHVPWPLQPARAEIAEDTLTHWLGVRRPDTPPRLHFARSIDVLVWRPERLAPPQRS